MKTARQETRRMKLTAQNWRGSPRWGGRERWDLRVLRVSPSRLYTPPSSLRTASSGSSSIRLYYTYPALWLALSPSRHPHHEHQQPAQRLCSPCLWAASHTQGSESGLVIHSDSILSYLHLGCSPVTHPSPSHRLWKIPSTPFPQHHLCLSSSSPLVTITQGPPLGHFQS